MANHHPMTLGRERMGDSPELELVWRMYDRALTLRLAKGGRPILWLALSTAAPAQVSLTTVRDRRRVAVWHLEDLLPPLGQEAEDVFSVVREQAVLYLGLDAASGSFRRLEERLQELAHQAIARCEPRALALARRFPKADRFEVYQRLVADRTGRIGQAVETCPGAILLTLELIHQGGPASKPGEQLLAGLRDGKRLDRLIDGALDAMYALVQPFGDGPADPEQFSQIRLAHRLLIRRAGPLVPFSLLGRLPPIALVPEDIPQDPLLNAQWFEVMRSQWEFDEPYEGRHAPELRALARLVSSQPRTLAECEPREMSTETKLVILRDFLVGTHRRPARSRDVASVLDEAVQWHRDLAQEQQDALQGLEDNPWGDTNTLAGTTQLPRLHDLPDPPPGVRVTQLLTVADLLEEGLRMHHCIATRVQDALAGNCYLFSVEVANRPLTVELVRKAGCLRVGDVRGKGNREPTEAEWSILKPWLLRLRGRKICGRG